MKVYDVVVLSSMSIAATLLFRRLIKIRKSVALFNRLCERLQFKTMPKSYFRVAISGTTKGIGKACLDLLSGFESVEVCPISRIDCRSMGIHIELTNALSCKNCAEMLNKMWFTDERIDSGEDIVVHNAGVFHSSKVSDVLTVNALAPCYITEALCNSYQSCVRSRSLRFVYVGSRLEKRSNVDDSNIRETISNGLLDIETYRNDNSYADSKRAVMLHTSYMCSKYRDSPLLSFGVVTPGMVNTDIGRTSVNFLVWFITAPLRFLFLRHPIEGAVAVLYAAFSDKNGLYAGDPGEILEYIPDSRSACGGRVLSELIRDYYM